MKTLFRKLLTWRVLLWCVLSGIAILALVHWAVNWTGERRWAAMRGKIEADGETLDFKKLLPLGIEESRNFCAIEALQGITIPGDAKSPAGSKRRALEFLGERKTKSGAVTTEGTTIAHKVNLETWVKYALETKLLPAPPASETAARELWEDLDRRHPVLKELATASVTRTEAAFVPGLHERELPEFLYTLPMVHYRSVQQIGSVVRYRGALAMESGDTTAAMQCALVNFRLAEACLREPQVLASLTGGSAHHLGAELLWSLLEKSSATAADLAAMQAALLRLDFLKANIAAARGELAIGINGLDFIQSRPDPLHAFFRFCRSELDSSPIGNFYARLIPTKGFLNLSKVVHAHLQYEQVIQPLKTANFSIIQSAVMKGEAELKTHSSLFHPTYIYSLLASPSQFIQLNLAYSAEVVRRQGMLACALERYFLLHQTYPASLSALVPAFISEIPTDPIDHLPMRYRQTTAGRYMLWSIGFDQQDDGGQVNIFAKNVPITKNLNKADYKGDWAWQYEEVMAK